MTAVPTQTDPGAGAALACVLLTGASGALGQVLREPLRQRCLQAGGRLRLSDRVALTGAPLQEGEEFVACDLADRPGMHALLRGVSAVVHLGGVSVEGPFDPILKANILGVFHLYEAARVHGVSRIVVASSNHATGCYEQGHVITAADPPRPDGYYGVSKLFAEHMAEIFGVSVKRFYAQDADGAYRWAENRPRIGRKSWSRCTTTATASRACACASAPQPCARRTGVACPPGLATRT